MLLPLGFHMHYHHGRLPESSFPPPVQVEERSLSSLYPFLCDRPAYLLRFLGRRGVIGPHTPEGVVCSICASIIHDAQSDYPLGRTAHVEPTRPAVYLYRPHVPY